LAALGEPIDYDYDYRSECNEQGTNRTLEEDEPMSNNFEFGNCSDDIDECYEAIEQAIQDLARKGLIVDTGCRRWSERTRSYHIVWAARETLH